MVEHTQYPNSPKRYWIFLSGFGMYLRILQDLRGQTHLFFRSVSLHAVEKFLDSASTSNHSLKVGFIFKKISPAIFFSSNSSALWCQDRLVTAIWDFQVQYQQEFIRDMFSPGKVLLSPQGIRGTNEAHLLGLATDYDACLTELHKASADWVLSEQHVGRPWLLGASNQKQLIWKGMLRFFAFSLSTPPQFLYVPCLCSSTPFHWVFGVTTYN